MARSTKIIVSLVAGIAALFAVAAVAFLFLFDPNDFREEAATAVKEATGRDLVIEGDISLQIVPWLAVEVGRASLGDAPGFGDKPFAAIESASLSVKFWPLLLSREVSVGTAEINGLRLNLMVDRNGRGNWEDLVAQDEGTKETEEPAGEAGTLDIAGFDLSDAVVSYTDLKTGETYSLRDAQFSIGRITSAPDSNAIGIGGFSLEGVVDGIGTMPSELEFSTAGIELQVADQVVVMQPVSLAILGLRIEADFQPLSYAGAVEPMAAIKVDAFSPRSLMHLFGVEQPLTADPVVLSNVIFDAQAAVRSSSIDLTEMNITIDDTTFAGSLSLPTDAAGAFEFELRGDTIDLNRYMAPPVEDESAATQDDQLPPVEIPVDLIKALNLRGQMELESVVMGPLQLDQVKVGLNAGKGRLRIFPISSALYGGSYNGDVRIDVAGSAPVLSLDEKVSEVDLAQIALAMFEQENITGSLDGNFKLSGRGKDMAEIQQSLGGTMSIALNDGAYEGTDIWFELRRARALLKQETPPEPVLPARTKFTSVKASGVVTDGVMRNDDLVADLPFMQLTGSGDVNIVAGTVDYDLRARVYRKPDVMGGATAEEIDDLTKTVIPLKITGSLASPTVAPDVEELLRQRVEEEIKDKLGDKLKDIFGR